jgi:bla regulator protein BlaR1
MLTIVLKIILCSGVLLGLYYLFLAKEKTFTFNRFFLISALVFSLCIPFVNIETKQAEKEIPETGFIEGNEQPIETQIVIPEENFDFTKALFITYCIVSMILILKIGYSIIKIKTLKGRKIKYQNRNIFLLKQDLAPFSFLNTIYLSETYFKDSKIENSVFLHEEIHVKQKHSLDILFVEILKAVFWINPFIYFYKKEMINNHEFIADERVIKQNKNIRKYQELILQEVLKQQNLPLIHQFNFNNTKKRFIMMTRKNSKFAKVKNYLAIPAFVVLAIVFAEKTYAKEVSVDIKPENIQKKTSETKLSENLNAEILKPENIKTDIKPTKRDTIEPPKKAEVKISEVNKENDDQNIPPPPPPSSNFVQAEYPEGIQMLRNKFMQNFDSSILKDEKGIIKSVVYMVIDENGIVGKVVAKGNNEIFNKEAERALKSVLADTKWKPATNHGERVKTAYSLPLTMTFESPQKTQ